MMRVPAFHVSRNLRTTALFGGLYLLLSLLYTWPLVLHLGRGVAHDLGDPLLNTWILWWSTQAVPLTTHWWNAPAFYPATGILAFSEHLLGLAPIAAPLTALTHLPLLGYNVALIATFVFSALAAHFLGYTLTGRHDAAFVAGVAFAFAPYRLAQLPHIQILASYWTPVCLAALHRYGRDGRGRWALLAAGAWTLQALSCGYYLFFLSVLLVLWFVWFCLGRWPVRQIVGLACLFAVAALPLVPILSGYQGILRDTYGLSRGLTEIRGFSADIASLLYASEELLLWSGVHVISRPEAQLFPGVTIVVLIGWAVARASSWSRTGASRRVLHLRIVLGAAFLVFLAAALVPIVHGTFRLTVGGLRLLSIARADKPMTLALIAAVAGLSTLPRVRAAIAARSIFSFYLLAAFAMWMLALGPEPTLLDARALYQAPYAWLMRLPGFDGLRVPARFWMMALVCLSAAAALAVNRVGDRARRWVPAIVALGLLLDGWPRQFSVVPAPELRRAPLGAALRLNLPSTDDIDAAGLYEQMFDPLPLVNGFSGYRPPHYEALRLMLFNHDPRMLLALSSERPLGVVIDHAGDSDGAYRRYVQAIPGAVLSETRPGWSSYRLPISGAEKPPDRHGTPIRIKSLVTFPSPPHAARALDGDLWTRWSGGVQQQSADMTIELENATRVGQVVLDLGPFAGDFPARLEISVSPDGTTWQVTRVGDTVLEAYFAGLRHPREMPLVFPINRDGVRFLRMRQIGFSKQDWSVAELHVLQ